MDIFSYFMLFGGIFMLDKLNTLKDDFDYKKVGGAVLLGIAKPGTAVDWNDVIFKGLTLQGIYGRQMFETWYKMGAMVEAGLDLTPMITHRFNYRDFEKGFEAMNSGMSGKVVLDWTK